MTAVAASVPAVTRPTRVRRRWASVLWLLPPLVVVLGFFCYPLALVLRQSFVTRSGEVSLAVWQQVVTSPEFTAALGRTVLLSLGATAGCVLLGTFLALVLAFAPFPGARVVSRIVDAVLAFPSFLIALAFTFLYGSAGVLNAALGGQGGGPVDFLYGPWGVLLAEVTFYTPFVMRPVLAAFAQVPSAQLDVAASLGARPALVLWRVALPEAWPALASGACLTLLLTMNEFGIVLFVGAKDVITLPMLVHTKGIVTFDYPAACVVAVVNVLLSVALYAAHRWVFRVLGAGRSGEGRRGAVPNPA
ncbi:2-aminoethylphosphonate transport system permease protein [Streptoalloteichus tenebrarius]|uniref:2-aminoethylphosphonate transport system permease protein n=1 Tax=Streptoalloteichus tenebrarius (strain ATCC 17920 / DSM 40477 / JCM 4838 / CBS 697.72 / NBRC 16177 / NCIMB 11028 / NRRL B-12390 / A12253. 1 / ISP 5477) TaxID=1933 RepID=A0ABT1HMU0_STRSD|nr:2-aminoethylphosphonate ABC transporter permease subunit [Streptoalloteichus tenebrarius]MCP2256820.1 2-aminoethylphosphonate transport system permease protein [Streptoalloteichus tenebrarius]BFF00272.1 2-aminoethylphosphonate ABC transporter permease subunit [Streptoalloteichus tenebrarius]